MDARAASMCSFELIGAGRIVSRDTGHREGQAMLGAILDRMRIRHRDTREPECQQDNRNHKPAQQAPASCS